MKWVVAESVKRLEKESHIANRLANDVLIIDTNPISKEVAIALNLEADTAIRYYHQYFMPSGITEFTKAYLQK